ncbi:amino acid adenylation domain-containing protein [Nocardia sp. SSK8]|uniref:amino acid adenylation domain-containing protein n=1 Tax=Nocardia sp. SSK8 TaxID=3120154 RepID=UPI00300867FF
MTSVSTLPVDAGSAYPRDATLPALFLAQAAARPDALAARHHDRALTYGELAGRAQALTARLLARGVEPGEPIGVCGGRSLEALVAVLGILGAGCAYVPLDEELPPARRRAMAEDAGLRLAVGLPGSSRPVRGVRTLALDDESAAAAPESAAPAASATDPAFVVFTSGTTGRPKPVVVPHRGVVRLVLADERVPRPGPGDRILHAYGLSSDASTIEIWGALLTGASLVLVDRADLLAPAALARVLADGGVTIAYLTTSVFHLLARTRPETVAGLRLVSAGGEAMDPLLAGAVQAACPGTTVVNFYGPTENSVVSTAHVLEPGHPGPVPLGRPFGATTCHVLRSDGSPAAPGEEGELYVGGDGLALGYLGDPGLTAERFVRLPALEPDGPLYRTGDRARWTAEGLLEYRGRLDRQVKVRGVRVELDEVEARLRLHPEVGEAVVEAGESGLAAYITPAAPGRALSVPLLRAYCAEWLPPQAVPRLIPLEQLPVTSGGKVDRSRLPKAEGAHSARLAADHLEKKALPVGVAGDCAGEEVLPAGVAGDSAGEEVFPAGVAGDYAGEEMRPADAAGDRAREEVHSVGVAADCAAEGVFPGGCAVECVAVGSDAVGEGGVAGLRAVVAEVWWQVLRVRPGPGDEFFALGGDSLLAAEAVTRTLAVLDLDAALGSGLVRALLDAPTLDGFVAAVAEVRGGGGGAAVPEVDFDREIVLGVDFAPVRGPAPCPADPADVLLTGASGFVGAFLLDRLLRSTSARIHCPVRATGRARAEQRVRTALARYGLRPDPAAWQRVECFPGELTEPRLGLAPEHADRLADTVDLVIHSAAHVNFVYPYAALRAANVDGTREIVRIAAPRRVPVHFLSTVAVLAGFGAAGIREVAEDRPLAHADGLTMGYAESKWVAEGVLREAARQGLPVTVYRPYEVMGDRATGVCNTDTALCSLFQTIAETGLAPDIALPMDFVPVDHLAECVVHIATRERGAGRVHHLTNPRPALLADVLDRMRVAGFAVRTLPYAQWVGELVRYVAEHPASATAPFVPLCVDRSRTADMSVKEMFLAETFPVLGRANIEAALADSGLHCPPVDSALIDHYLGYLLACGYLRTPVGSRG